MFDDQELSSIPSGVVEALRQRGFEALTPVQQAVLAPEARGRDLRISSETASGKTVALGLTLAPELADASAKGAVRALVLAPTRELAQQVQAELTWLLAPLRARVAVCVGGTSFGREAAELRKKPSVVVATPGRLLDHLTRGTLDASQLTAVVLDEADQMLDFGFREELEGILGHLPEVRRTHLVSATFPAPVRTLADTYQREAWGVMGTALGEANRNITHLLHVVPMAARYDALVNVLLCDPAQRSIVFVRTRAGAAELAERLAADGFSAAALSGDLAQAERSRRLTAFRAGTLATLVATDVAARGIDVPDVARVIHLHVTSDADAYTHRSGRTGRAGQRGHSIVIATPRERLSVERLWQRLGLQAQRAPVPTPAQIQQMSQDRLVSELSAERTLEARHYALARRLLADAQPEEVLAKLLAAQDSEGPCQAREVAEIAEQRPRKAAPSNDVAARPDGPFATLQINWGARDGADARRLVALICRRGDIASRQIGAIRVGPRSSHVEVEARAADAVVRAFHKVDARDPNVRVRLSADRGPLPARPRAGGGKAAPRRQAPVRGHASRGHGARARSSRA